MEVKMRKKIFVIFFVLMVITIGLSSAVRTVTLWSFAANNIQEWESRKADIEKKFNIKLNIELIAENAFVQKLQAVMMDGKGSPDIIEWLIENNRILNANPKKSYVLPLDKYVNRSDVFNNVVPGRVAWVKYGSHTYGLPHDVHPVVLIYNDTLWKSVGVDMEKIETWDQFFDAAKKLSAEKKNGKPVHYALPDLSSLNGTMFIIWQQTGAQILDKMGKPNLDSREFKEFVAKYIDWYKSGVMCEWDWANFASLLKNGTLASYTAPDWWVPQVTDAANSGEYKFKVRALPYYKKGGPQTASWGGTFLAIPRNAKKPDQLYAIMEYMQYDTSAIKTRYEQTEMLPPFASVWNDAIFKRPDPRFGGQKLGELQTKLAKDMPTVNSGDVIWETIFNCFNPQYTEIISNKISLEKGLARAQKDAMKIYKKMKK
jgi:ABC-type glycerol-3-phosphate transport system substrate-binding protein